MTYEADELSAMLDQYDNYKNVLRTALYELRHQTEPSPGIIINDAVETAKKYSTEDSGRFVNGILGSYLREIEEAGREQDEEEIGARP